jgi:hypothetical protein
MRKVELVYCATEEMVPNALTKPLASDNHGQLLGKMALKSMEFNDGKRTKE